MKAALKQREDGKYMIQVLLPPNRGKLYIEHLQRENAEKESEQQPSSHLRDLVFDFIQTKYDADQYNDAKKQDELSWQNIVARRVEGREKARQDELEKAEKFKFEHLT